MLTPDASTPSCGFPARYREVLSNILATGKRVPIGRSLSIASERVTIEKLNYGFTLEDPRDRLLVHPLRRLNIFTAVGRFVWMMSGSDRLRDIEFYEPRARVFSDDGLTIPGSSEGARLINAAPGLNQIAQIIDLIKRETHTRRAAAVTYFPGDVGRVSRDIPCVLGATYNVRFGVLHATTIMRANDALRVLPYDLFFFSMLAEIIAVMTGSQFGSYHHFSVSLHVYEDDRQEATDIVATPEPSPSSIPMGPIPGPDPWADATKLVQFEASVRAAWREVRRAFPDYVAEAMKTFDPYWRDFALIVVLHALRKCDVPQAEYRSAVASVKGELGPAFQAVLQLEG